MNACAVLLRVRTVRPLRCARGLRHTALMQACSEGRAHIVTAMCKRGALPDFIGKHGRTALIEAARNGHLDVIRALAAGSSTIRFVPKARF